MTESTYTGRCQHCNNSSGAVSCSPNYMVEHDGDCPHWRPKKLSRAQKRKTERRAKNVERK